MDFSGLTKSEIKILPQILFNLLRNTKVSQITNSLPGREEILSLKSWKDWAV